MDLFGKIEAANRKAASPLAARMRPTKLDDLIGQEHLLGENSAIRRLLAAKRLGCIVLHGPPGSGKTTLARILADAIGSPVRTLSAVTSGVKELRETLAWAADRVAAGDPRPTVFIDEFHRFHRGQQDALLHDVEEGTINLIAATTETPSFAINSALLSRAHVVPLHPLGPDELRRILERAVGHAEGLGPRRLTVEAAAIEAIALNSDGDARRALTLLELVADSLPAGVQQLDLAAVAAAATERTLRFDRSGREHYDWASAMIKSIRGSDADAALYWLAMMLESGEDIRFICRRLVILASEDVGNADPQALPLAVAAMQACELIGLPECQLTLSQTVIYLALAPKSNSATLAIAAARSNVREQPRLPVPVYLQDSHSGAAKAEGKGAAYRYAHDYPEGVARQEYLTTDLRFYEPVERGREAEMARRYRQLRRLLGREDSAGDMAGDNQRHTTDSQEKNG